MAFRPPAPRAQPLFRSGQTTRQQEKVKRHKNATEADETQPNKPMKDKNRKFWCTCVRSHANQTTLQITRLLAMWLAYETRGEPSLSNLPNACNDVVAGPAYWFRLGQKGTPESGRTPQSEVLSQIAPISGQI